VTSSVCRTAAAGEFEQASKALVGLLEKDTGWTDQDVDAAAAILDNVAYWILYLESNHQHLQFEDLETWRKHFFEDPATLAGLRRRLASAAVAGQTALLRDRLLRRAELVLSPEHTRLQADLGLAYERLGALAADSEQRQAALAERLGFDLRGNRSAVVAYAGLRRVASAPQRARVQRAFATARDETLDEACDVLDRIAVLHREVAAQKGAATPLQASLDGSGVTEGVATAFLDDYLRVALTDTGELTTEISDALGEAMPLPLGAHAGRYLTYLAGGRSTPHLPLQGCLAMAFELASRLFGVTCSLAPVKPDETVLVVEATREGGLLGRIQIDLQGGVRSSSTPNLTLSAHELPLDEGGVSIPVAMISCRFSSRGRDAVLNLQNVHSLMHEFGHAVNHVLLTHRTGSPSGLDHLPIERIELMSMWFERWAFSEDLADRCALSAPERADFAFAVRAKGVEYRLSQLERGALAGVDMLVNGSSALPPGLCHFPTCRLAKLQAGRLESTKTLTFTARHDRAGSDDVGALLPPRSRVVGALSARSLPGLSRGRVKMRRSRCRLIQPQSESSRGGSRS
jgi:oligopeptidase A